MKGLASAAGIAVAAAAQAAPITYYGFMSGAAESPPNGSTATGSLLVSMDTTAHILAVSFEFSGLGSGTVAAHIHCCTLDPLTLTAGVATQTPYFVGYLTGVTAESYSHTFDTTLTSTYNPAFVTAQGGTAAAAEAALASGMSTGRAYLNIHSVNFAGGEIRSFLFPDAVFADGFQ
jgi:hypothetical protein